MDKSENAFITLGKFLAIASAVKVYRQTYSNEIPEEIMTKLLNELETISNNYLNPLYTIKYDKDDDWGIIPYDTNYDEDDFLNDIGC